MKLIVRSQNNHRGADLSTSLCFAQDDTKVYVNTDFSNSLLPDLILNVFDEYFYCFSYCFLLIHFCFKNINACNIRAGSWSFAFYKFLAFYKYTARKIFFGISFIADDSNNSNYTRLSVGRQE